MHYKRTNIRLLALILACALLLCGCSAGKPGQYATDGNALATNGNAVEIITAAELPMITPEAVGAQTPAQMFPVNAPTGEANEIVVSTVDEFLAAIGSDRTIYLQPGEYTLTEATDYGQAKTRPFYEWTEVYDGYGLVIRDVQNLKIVGHNADEVEINTVPRYADVLYFTGCSGVTVNSVTAGHKEGPGNCAGSVLYFESTDTVRVGYCNLYGCGTVGADMFRCADALVENSIVRDCSIGGVRVIQGQDVRIQNCTVINCGYDTEAEFALSVEQSNEVAFIDCKILGNDCRYLLTCSYSQNVQLLGSLINDNRVSQAMLFTAHDSPVIEGCAFTRNQSAAWYDASALGVRVQAVSRAGKTLQAEDLQSMQLADVPYEAPEPTAPVELDATMTADGMREVRVSTIDEFLAAITSNTTVYLADGTYNFSNAANYGAMGTDGYYWEDVFDGPGLILENLTNFHIVGNGADKAFLNALPRYADVLCYRNCENVSITGVTLGHFKARGECCGGVLRFAETNTVTIRDCGLFGCGIFGIDATDCSGFTVEQTEIYDCSVNGVSLSSCKDMAFTGCDIHDCGEPMWNVNRCENVTVDGKAVESTQY